MMYRVIPYEEAPCEPQAAIEFTTRAAAEAYAAEQMGTVFADYDLAGERYDEDGTTHICAYYQDVHRSSGLWVVEAGPKEAAVYCCTNPCCGGPSDDLVGGGFHSPESALRCRQCGHVADAVNWDAGSADS